MKMGIKAVPFDLKGPATKFGEKPNQKQAQKRNENGWHAFILPYFEAF